MKKRKVTRKTNKVDELSREENLSHEAKVILRNVANMFIETCFNGTGHCCYYPNNVLNNVTQHFYLRYSRM